MHSLDLPINDNEKWLEREGRLGKIFQRDMTSSGEKDGSEKQGKQIGKDRMKCYSHPVTGMRGLVIRTCS
jgi:hypothetical protein